MTEVQKVKDAFSNNQLNPSLLCEVFCGRTNEQLKTLQEDFANDSNVALKDFVSEKIEAATTVNKREQIKDFIIRVLANQSDRYSNTSVDTTRATADAKKLKKPSPEKFLKVFLDEGGSMTFSQVKETVNVFGGKDAFIKKLKDCLPSIFQDLAVKYIEFALK